MVRKISTEVIQIFPDETPSYLEWNKWLCDHFFNEELDGIEIGCFPVTEDLFEQISNYEFTFDDFIESIESEIGNKNFVSKLQTLLDNSTPRIYNGRTLRKPVRNISGLCYF